MLKNVVLNHVVRIKNLKARKGLKESVEAIMAKKHAEEAVKRLKLKKQILRDYEEK
jgi:hypothetical protein